MIALSLANDAEWSWAQQMVTEYHYLHAPVDARSSPEAYLIHLSGEVFGITPPVGCLIFGRPEATRCSIWYGSVEDVQAGKCEVTRWEVLNLSRVFLIPEVQAGGKWYNHHLGLPGFRDRRGVWRSTLASETIKAATLTIGYDYLCQRPPVFPEQPFQIRWLLSYCNPAFHKGTIYRMAGWELYRTNEEGLQTWRFPLPLLTSEQDAHIRHLAEQHPRSRRYRSQRAAAAQATQLALLQEI